MGLGYVIAKGVDAAREEGEARLRAELPPDAPVDDALDAVASLPRVLLALDRVWWREGASAHDRALLPLAVSYGLRDDNVVPVRAGAALAGVLDDAYVVISALSRAEMSPEDPDPADVARWLAALRHCLPEEVVVMLDDQLSSAVEELEGRLGERDG